MTAAVPLWLVIVGCLVAVPALLVQAHRHERDERARRRMIAAARRHTS